MDDTRGLLRRSLIWATALLLAAWVAAEVLAPGLIATAYDGGIAWLDGLIEGREARPLAWYVEHWRGLTRPVLGLATALLLVTIPALLVASSRDTTDGTDRESAGAGRAIRVWQGLSLVLVAGSIVVLWAAPASFIQLVREDAGIEWATALAFWAGFVYLLLAMAADRHLRLPGILLLALAALFVAGEEMSWGQRVFGFASGEYFLRNNIQGETNLHNLTIVQPWWEAVAVLLWVVGLPWTSGRFSRVASWRAKIGVPLPPLWLRPLFLAAAALLLLAHAPLLVPNLTEVAELALGVGVAVLGLELAARACTGTVPDRVRYRGSGVLAGIIGMSAWGMVSIAPPSSSGPWLHNFAGANLPDRGLYAQADRVFAYLEEHPELAADTTLLERGRVLTEAGARGRAAAVLRREIAREERLAAVRPADPAPHRRMMAALLLLGEEEAADRALSAALRRDSLRLARASEDGERALVRWSIANTLAKAGGRERALSVLAALCDSVPTRRLARRVHDWMRVSLPNATPPGRCGDPLRAFP